MVFRPIIEDISKHYIKTLITIIKYVKMVNKMGCVEYSQKYFKWHDKLREGC